MAGPQYRERLKTETIAIARKILSEEGLAALQARRVAKEAGCSVGTIYNLYNSLDDLIIFANAGTLEALGQTLQDEVQSSRESDFATRLTRLGLAYLGFAIESEAAWRALFEHRMAADAFVPDWYRERQADLFRIVEQVLGVAISEAAMREQAARALFAAVHGIVAIALDQKLGNFDRVGTEAQIKLVVGAVAAGLVKGVQRGQGRVQGDGGTLGDLGQARNAHRQRLVVAVDRLSDAGAQHFVQDASYVRVRELGLYYTFPDKTHGKVLKGMRVGVSLNNWFTFTKYKSYDPEVSNFGINGINTGVEVAPYPSSKRAFLHIAVDL